MSQDPRVLTPTTDARPPASNEDMGPIVVPDGVTIWLHNPIIRDGACITIEDGGEVLIL